MAELVVIQKDWIATQVNVNRDVEDICYAWDEFDTVYDVRLMDLEIKLLALNTQAVQCIRTLTRRIEKLEEQHTREIKGISYEVRFYLFHDLNEIADSFLVVSQAD